MKRIFIFKIVMFAAFLLNVVSCSMGSKESYVSLIPKDVVQIVSVDLQSISDKAGLNDAENDKYKEQLISLVASGTPTEASTLIKSIIEDPALSGVDFKSPIYMFLPSGEMITPSMVAKMGNIENFDTLIKTIIDTKILKDVVTNDSFSYSETNDGEVAILYNKDFILVVNNSVNPRDYPAIRVGSELYDGSLLENIYDNGGFEEMLSQKGDIKFFTSFASLPKGVANQVKMANSATNFDVTKMMFVGATSFDRGEVNATLSYYTEDPELKDLIKENLSVTEPMNGKILKKLPASSLLVASSYINGEAVCKAIEEHIETNPEFSRYFTRDKEAVDNAKKFINTIDGDVVISPIEFNSMSDFTVILFAELNSDGEKVLKEIVDSEMVNDSSVKILEDNKYAYETRYFSFYFGIEDGVFYFTNKKSYDLEKSEDPSIASTHPSASGMSMFATANCSEIVCLCSRMGLMRSVPREFRTALQEIDIIESTTTKEGVISLRVVLKEENVNSLKYMLDYVKKLID